MRLHDFLWLRLTKFWILISLTIFWNRIIIQSTTAYSARVFLNAGMLYYGRKGVLNLSIFRFYLSFVFWPHSWLQQEMFYTEITETTCKTVRFSGIYGLYVNNSVQKTHFFGFGYWRPGVLPLGEKFAAGVPHSIYYVYHLLARQDTASGMLHIPSADRQARL